MVTVNISESTLEFLKEFMDKLNTQDNRSTASPYMYVVRDVRRVYGIDDVFDSAGSVWYNFEDGSSYLTDEELMDAFDAEEKDCVEDIANDNGYDYVRYTEIRVIKNIFFTEEAAIDHIKECHYHYNDPDIHVEHLVKNNELLDILDAIAEVVDDELITK
jgi:hypothetical protein